MKSDKRRTAGTIVALTGGVCWGFSDCCGQYLFERKGVEAPWLVAMGLFSAGTILALAGFKLHGRDNLGAFRKERDTIHLLAFVIFGIAFYQFAYFMAIQVSNARAVIALQCPLPILILAVMCARELRLPKELELATIGLSLFDTFAIGIRGDIHSFHITGGTLFWGLLAAMSSMIYVIIPGGPILKYDIYQALGFGMFFGGIAMGAVVRSWNYGVVQDTGIVEALAGVVVVGTAITFGLCLQGVSVVGPSGGSIMGSVEPASAVIISVSQLGTRFTLPDFLGFTLILGVVFMLTFAHRPGGETAKGADFSANP